MLEDDVDLKSLKLSTRTFHTMLNDGVHTVGEARAWIVKRKRFQQGSVGNFGKKSWNELCEALGLDVYRTDILPSEEGVMTVAEIDEKIAAEREGIAEAHRRIGKLREMRRRLERQT